MLINIALVQGSFQVAGAAGVARANPNANHAPRRYHVLVTPIA